MLGFTLTTALYLCHKLQYFKEAHWPSKWIDTAKKYNAAMVKLMFFNKFDIAWEIKYI